MNVQSLIVSRGMFIFAINVGAGIEHRAMTINAAKFFQRWEGKWRLARTINDSIHGNSYCDGEASFIPQAKETLLYREKGVLAQGLARLSMSQEYIYCLMGSMIHVYFSKHGKALKLFHTLHFMDEKNAEGKHFCGNDHYATTYTWMTPDYFSITHAVKGLQKEYRSHTYFVRA